MKYFKTHLTTLILATLLAGGLVLAQESVTRGPSGEAATPSGEITLTDDEVAQVREGNHTAALLWHTSSDFINAVSAGAIDEFERLGVQVVATTDAGFDAARQRNDIETAMARNPSVILALPLDPITSAEAFRTAREEGVQLVFLSNTPSGYVQGEDFVAIVTDDLFQMGKQAADALAEALGGEGQVAWIYHDAQYYVTNQRDNAFRTTIENEYPNIEIVSTAGITDPARAEEIAQALLLRNPDLDGIYVTWAEPAEGVLAALRAAGNTTTKIVTLDLSEPIGLDMIRGGNVIAIVADEAYELGRTMATAAAYGLLGKEAPPFIVAPALTVTRDNVAQGWQDSLHREAPASILREVQ
jgi:ribose transport system substrate-binding protein